MGGIAGIFGAKCKTEEMQMMLDRISHRGEGEFQFFSGEEDVFLIAQLALPDQESAPIFNDGGNICIVFSGNVYNYDQLRQDLAEYNFQTDSDGELVLHLYEKMGAACAAMLDGIFAFAICDLDKGLFIARDPLGIKPLYISEGGDTTYFVSEMKALVDVDPNFQEFPIGTYYQSDQGFTKYYDLTPEIEPVDTMEEAMRGINDYLRKAIQKRLETELPLGVYLSGGLDSSIIAALATEEIGGIDSFAVGMEGSQDIEYARLCADYLGTNHYEYIYNLDEMVEVLPEVIYYLESFDAALVRSSVANYFLARLAGEEAQVVLSGEGADELFCGYKYLQKMPRKDIPNELFELVGTLHNTSLQRGDRMSMAHGLEAQVPFLDLDFVNFAFNIPLSMKLGPENQEKWVLREAFSDLLPGEIVYREKKKFSEGAGSFLELADVAQDKISDDAFACMAVTSGGHQIKNKEELMYYQIFREHYPEGAVEKAIDFSRSL